VPTDRPRHTIPKSVPSTRRRTLLRERLIARSTRPAAIDLEAAREVRRRGWVRMGHDESAWRGT
jgi:hypothetical protein